MACTGIPCARCWPIRSRRGTGDRVRPRGPNWSPSLVSSTGSWRTTSGVSGSSATRPSASSSASGMSTDSTADTPRSRTTSESTAVRPRRCSCRCPIRRATPSATSARPWWSSAAWSKRPTASPGPAPQRRLLRQGLPVREHRGLPGWPRVSPRLSGRSAPGHSLRQYQAGGGEDTGRWTP